MNDPDLFSGLAITLLLMFFGSLILFATRQHRQDLRFQIRLFVISIALRFFVAIVIYQFGLVTVIKDEDASGWVQGVTVAQSWAKKDVSLFDLPLLLGDAYVGHHQGYRFLVGTLFFITDAPARLPAAALNCFFGALTVIFAYRIALSFLSQQSARRVAWWTCLFPSMIIWSAQTLKEPIVILLETVALYGCVRLKLSGFSIRHLALCAAAIILVIPFRFYAAYVAGAAVLLTLLLPQISRRRTTLASAVLIISLVIPLLATSGVLVQHEAEFEKFDVERIQRFRNDVTTGSGSGSAVKSNFDMKSPTGFVGATLFGAAHLMLAPFPWQLGGASLRMFMTLPELIVWWWLFFFGVVPGFWYAIRNRFTEIQPLLFFIMGLGLLYSVMFGNVGLAYRQRAQLLPWLFIFASIGLERRAIRKLLTRRRPQVRMQGRMPVAPQPVQSGN
ncbi:MAG TPA: hypothetical protein VFD58_31490 [Blastocatellia bacterium]|nr:hypothetical protein [Blastocatellia bacterium]